MEGEERTALRMLQRRERKRSDEKAHARRVGNRERDDYTSRHKSRGSDDRERSDHFGMDTVSQTGSYHKKRSSLSASESATRRDRLLLQEDSEEHDLPPNAKEQPQLSDKDRHPAYTAGEPDYCRQQEGVSYDSHKSSQGVRKRSRIPKKQVFDGDNDFEGEPKRKRERKVEVDADEELHHAEEDEVDHAFAEEEDKIETVNDTKLKSARRKRKSLDSDFPCVDDRKALLSAGKTRQKALQSSKEDLVDVGSSLVDFSEERSRSTSKKQKEVLSAAERQLKKEEAAQKRKHQVEKAAEEIQDTRKFPATEMTASQNEVTDSKSKPWSLTPEAISKAKLALEKQKMLAEKLKKIPKVNQPTPTVSSSVTPVSAPQTRTVGSDKTLPATTAIGTYPAPPTYLPNFPGLVPGAAPLNDALKKVQEVAARLGISQPTDSFLSIMQGNGFGTNGQQREVKRPVLRLDAQGREIDEHGNVVERTKISNLSTLKVNINKHKKESFQILPPELEEDQTGNKFFDPDMGLDKKKLLRPRRPSFQFVAEGTLAKQAEILRMKSRYGEAQAKEIRLKQAALAKAKAEADINPNLIEVSERLSVKEKPKDPIPDVEWWDAVLLPSGNYPDSLEGEPNVKMEKLTIYIEHPVPIEPPAEPEPPPPQPLKLTKKERKKMRTQRRLAKEKEKQDLIRQGLMEPPKPKVKISNLMKVLAAEATQDPTKLEMEIRSAAAEREQAHIDRNLARKLTPAEKRKKKERKLFADPNTMETIVSVYKVNDLSHPQTRFKVDVNANENRLTGCIVICDSMTIVIVEGGSKGIKRYGKLMLQRIKWSSSVKETDEGANETGSLQENKCVLVWQGSVAKPNFEKFTVQQFRTDAAARKFLLDAKVVHYWDLAANFVEE